MATLAVDQSALVVRMSPLERVGALRSVVRQPLAAITQIERVENARRCVRGLRLPGTGVPGVILLGTFVKKGSKTFAAAYRDEPGYVVTFEGYEFTKIVVSMDESDEIDEIMSAATDAAEAETAST